MILTFLSRILLLHQTRKSVLGKALPPSRDGGGRSCLAAAGFRRNYGLQPASASSERGRHRQLDAIERGTAAEVHRAVHGATSVLMVTPRQSFRKDNIYWNCLTNDPRKI